MSTPLPPISAVPRPVRAEHVVMAGSVLALVVLVVLPLTFMVWGSVTGDGGLTLAHFRDALSSRLYVQALLNSLVLGAATAVLSVAVGLPLGNRLRESLQPEGRPGMPGLTFDVFSMAGLILVTVPHTFPFVYLLAASALESVKAGALGPVAALAIVTMLIVTAAIALATRLGRGKAGRQGIPPTEHAAVSQ